MARRKLAFRVNPKMTFRPRVTLPQTNASILHIHVCSGLFIQTRKFPNPGLDQLEALAGSPGNIPDQRPKGTSLEILSFSKLLGLFVHC